MPRRNKTPRHKTFNPIQVETSKRRFATKRQAEDAAKERMLFTPNLQLSVYREIDGGWYLTSRTSNDNL